jgi:hypothetical protein
MFRGIGSCVLVGRDMLFTEELFFEDVFVFSLKMSSYFL